MFSDRFLDNPPLDEWLVLGRDEAGVFTNVPHLHTHHSPTGFEFGYGGSGPADLALNIVEWVLRSVSYDGEKSELLWDRSRCFALSYALHQDFKWMFIAGAPREGGRISAQLVLQWVLERIPAPLSQPEDED